MDRENDLTETDLNIKIVYILHRMSVPYCIFKIKLELYSVRCIKLIINFININIFCISFRKIDMQTSLNNFELQ